MAHAQDTEELALLASEQAALRRLAILIARGAPPEHIFEAVITEVGRLLSADGAALSRFGPGHTLTPLGYWARDRGYSPGGTQHPLAPGTLGALIYETRRPGRVERYADVAGSLADLVRSVGWRSGVGASILVDGSLWGMVSVGSITDRRLPADTETRLADFAELLAIAIGNAESRAELVASRARIVATSDATRRRIERNIHDGVQQRLVSLALDLRAAQTTLPPQLSEHRAELSRVVEGMQGVMDELRQIAGGLHPRILTEGGLGPALRTLARRSPVPVDLDVRVDTRLPEPVEVAAYYVVSEALANATKHADASLVQVHVAPRDSVLLVVVRDDGSGGADPAQGSGLVGLRDRAEALGGTIVVLSPPGEGTCVQVELPLVDDGGGRMQPTDV